MIALSIVLAVGAVLGVVALFLDLRKGKGQNDDKG